MTLAPPEHPTAVLGTGIQTASGHTSTQPALHRTPGRGTGPKGPKASWSFAMTSLGNCTKQCHNKGSNPLLEQEEAEGNPLELGDHSMCTAPCCPQTPRSQHPGRACMRQWCVKYLIPVSLWAEVLVWEMNPQLAQPQPNSCIAFLPPQTLAKFTKALFVLAGSQHFIIMYY